MIRNYLTQLWKDYKHFRDDGYNIVDSIQLVRNYRTSGFGQNQNFDFDNYWICHCGNYIKDGCHCLTCFRNPCSCDRCQRDMYFRNEEDDWPDMFNKP